MGQYDVPQRLKAVDPGRCLNAGLKALLHPAPRPCAWITIAIRHYPPNVMIAPPATMSAPPIRIGGVGAWPNLARATICASRKTSTM